MLAGACQFGTAWAGLRLNPFIHSRSYLRGCALAGARQRHGLGGFIMQFTGIPHVLALTTKAISKGTSESRFEMWGFVLRARGGSGGPHLLSQECATG